MSAKIRLLTMAMAAALLLPLAVHAASILDQEYVPAGQGAAGIDPGSALGQSFTVGRDGFLDRVELDLERLHPELGPSTLTVEIRRITGSEVGDVLRSAMRSTADISASDFLSFDFLDLEIDVGDVFLIRLLTDLPSGAAEVFWGTDFGNAGDPPGTYAGGTAFNRDTPIEVIAPELIQDRGFRTFVTDEAPVAVPEPSALALIGAALAGLAVARRRVSRR